MVYSESIFHNKMGIPLNNKAKAICQYPLIILNVKIWWHLAVMHSLLLIANAFKHTWGALKIQEKKRKRKKKRKKEM